MSHSTKCTSSPPSAMASLFRVMIRRGRCCNKWAAIDSCRYFSSSSSSSSPTSSSPSFHRRKLPDSLIALSSDKGRRLFREALDANTLESYFPLSEQFVTQSEPSYCSLSSLAMVLNALNHDPKRTWKGVWRWVTEETLQCETQNMPCMHSLEKIRKEGMNFKDFEALGECHKVTIESFRSPTQKNIESNELIRNQYEIGKGAFRDIVVSSCKNNFSEINTPRSGFFVICNFSRKVLGQTGDGHFSPIGGYHENSDSVLVMDVARFKYPPYWVPVSRLWDSMAEDDTQTNCPRGFFVVRSANNDSSKHSCAT